jgi:hypothetical protein
MATDPLDRHPNSLTRTSVTATPTDKAVTLRVSRAAWAGETIAGAGLRGWRLGVGKILAVLVYPMVETGLGTA